MTVKSAQSTSKTSKTVAREYAQCAFCAYEDFAENMQGVPLDDDDSAWGKLEARHHSGCEWVETRAFTVNQ